jgi:C_GCAxxG_C_C family probable redox protein
MERGDRIQLARIVHEARSEDAESPGSSVVSAGVAATKSSGGGAMQSNTEIHRISLPQSNDWIERVKAKAETYMRKHESCAQCILGAFMEELGVDDPLVMASAGAFHAGLSTSLTCGIYTGGLMVLGLLMGRDRIEQGIDGLFPIMLPAQELVDSLQKKMGSSSCRELTGVDFTDMNEAAAFFGTEGHEKCISRVAEGAEEIASFLKDLNERGDLFRPEFKQ